LDAAFEAGLISFADDGRMLFSPGFTAADRLACGLPTEPRLRFVPEATKPYLAIHRTRHGFFAS
jgi:hypothetical protein